MFGESLAFSALYTLILASALAAPSSPSLLGDWARGDRVTKIRITRCGVNFCAVNTAANDPKGDEKVGDKLVMTLNATSPSSFEGQAFDEKRNLHYSMKVSVQQLSMTTHGCVLGGIVCKDASWTRLQ